MVDTFARIDFLKKIHLFYDLGEEELEDIAGAMEEISVGKGEVVFQQDSKSENFYLIYSGNVRITSRQQGKEIQLAVLVKNDYFGEMGMLGYVAGVQRKEIRQGIACVKHQNMSGSDIGDDHKEYFAGEAALKAGGKDTTMNQFGQGA